MSEITLSEHQLDELVTKRVETALQKHRADMDALRRNRDDLLRETKIAKSKALTAAAEALYIGANASLGANTQPNAASYALSRDDARDPAKYRAAKEAALRAGRDAPTLIDDTPAASPGLCPAIVETPRSIYLRHDQYRDPREFRRLKRMAEQTGRTLHPYASRNDLVGVTEHDADAVPCFDQALREGGR